MSIFSRKSPVATVTAPETPAEAVIGKGRPTPKRRDKAPVRGPVAPPPQTQREAFKRAKTVSRTPMTKEERKAAQASRRERMMRGEDTAVLPRDSGPVRRYIRDLVDSRRNLSGLLLPILLMTFIVSLISPVIQLYSMLIMVIALLAAILDSVVFGRQISRKVREKFPKGDPTNKSIRGFSLGYYAFNRAMLPRKWRAPRPRLRAGELVD